MPAMDSEEARGRMCTVGLLSTATKMGDKLYHGSGA